MIIVGGMIGLGKSSMAKLLGDYYQSEVFYESVADNPILPLFYTATEEEIRQKRYPFLLQLHFLNAKVKSMQDASKSKNAIIDRSIFEDWYFAKINKDLDKISDLEYDIYVNSLNNSLAYIENLKEKEPVLMIYLKGSFETVLKRIMERGRSYELDNSLEAYYKKLWHGYDGWIMKYHDKE